MEDAQIVDCLTGAVTRQPLTPAELAERQLVADEWRLREARRSFLAGQRENVQARFDVHALNGKTPGEIYQLVQARIDGWSSLAAAKADLRDWLPLLAAVVAWDVLQNKRTE